MKTKDMKVKAKGSHSAAQGRSSESGVTLVETMIATVLIMVGLTAVLGLFTVSMAHNQSYGDLASRCTTFCQAKIEELLALQFTDSATDTTVTPPAAAGGTGLGGLMAANATVGSIDPAAPAAGYVDYLDYAGTRVGPADVDANGNLLQFYVRQWIVQADATTNLKTITVRTTARRAAGAGPTASTILVSFKSRVL